ncbi:MAG: bifunctional diaminohydroxyphosphoribosylaminopyrimidine deaminase/5-amino-6-(5-phosphoribosylamino)uracil reductase RibD [Bacteroidales bacterium]|nr:bifunctional diaminohydroxyphosphoribosylaminopyrimidine deaminase/5-amino-6-(5-phosphoribosylamino)uracil reductase RibD [Bacteroidales bacterium]
MTQDEKYIQRTFELARHGVGKVNPNPLVGAVIVKNDRVIAEGYHHFFGGDHAEVDALNNATESVEGATVYVNLEPCAHHGKTPPCAERLVKAKVSRVVLSMRDPNPETSGKGIDILKRGGVEVLEGVLQKDAGDLNRVFVKYITTGLPFVAMKTAMTLDGKIATRVGDSKWVTGEKARALVHELRNEYAGIMVGVNTVIADNPGLTTRREGAKRNPVRIVVDSSGRIPTDVDVVNSKEQAQTILAFTEKVSPEKREIFNKGGIITLVLSQKQGKVDLEALLKKLGKRSIDGILLEGGGTLNYSMIEAGLVDEVFAFIAPKIVGGENSKTPVSGKGVDLMKDAIELTDVKTMSIENDFMIRGKVKQ